MTSERDQNKPSQQPITEGQQTENQPHGEQDISRVAAIAFLTFSERIKVLTDFAIGKIDEKPQPNWHDEENRLGSIRGAAQLIEQFDHLASNIINLVTSANPNIEGIVNDANNTFGKNETLGVKVKLSSDISLTPSDTDRPRTMVRIIQDMTDRISDQMVVLLVPREALKLQLPDTTDITINHPQGPRGMLAALTPRRLHDLVHIRGTASKITSKKNFNIKEAKSAFEEIGREEATLESELQKPYFTNEDEDPGEAVTLVETAIKRHIRSIHVDIRSSEITAHGLRSSPQFFREFVDNAIWNLQAHSESESLVENEFIVDAIGGSKPYLSVQIINGKGDWQDSIKSLNPDEWPLVKDGQTSGIGLSTLAEVAREYKLGTLLHRTTEDGRAILELQILLHRRMRRRKKL